MFGFDFFLLPQTSHNHLLVVAQVSVSPWNILVDDSGGLPQLPLVKCNPLKQYLQEQKCDNGTDTLVISVLTAVMKPS